MHSILVVRRAIHSLHRPFVQRLITLVVSTFLAMSLLSLTSLPVLTPLGGEVTCLHAACLLNPPL